MRRVVLAAALVLAAPALAGPPSVQPPSAPAADPLADADIGFRGCGSHAAVAGWLSRNFAEAPFARGLQGDGRLFELYMAKEGTTWTVVVTDPAGESCILTEGILMDVLPHEAPEPVA